MPVRLTRTIDAIDLDWEVEDSSVPLMEHGPWNKTPGLAHALQHLVTVGERDMLGVIVAVDEFSFHADIELEIPSWLTTSARQRLEQVRHQRVEYTDRDRAHEDGWGTPQYAFRDASPFVNGVGRARDSARDTFADVVMEQLGRASSNPSITAAVDGIRQWRARQH